MKGAGIMKSIFNIKIMRAGTYTLKIFLRNISLIKTTLLPFSREKRLTASLRNNETALEEELRIKKAKEILLQDIQKTQHALEIAYCGFDNVVEPDLIDCYIYEIASALKRYRFLMKQAEKMQLFYEDDNTIKPECVISKKSCNYSVPS